MQITIDKKTGTLLIIIVLLVGALFFVTTHRSDNTNNFMGMHGNSASSTNRFSGADVMFFQMMIPHHQQAVDISNLAMKKSNNPELKALAKEIAAGQSAEIIEMRSWLKDAGVSADISHTMHDQGGMLTEEELNNLKVVTGTEFDKAWLTGMIAHHEGALHMTTMITDSQKAMVKSFGDNIVKVQTAQIAQMKRMFANM